MTFRCLSFSETNYLCVLVRVICEHLYCVSECAHSALADPNNPSAAPPPVVLGDWASAPDRTAQFVCTDPLPFALGLKHKNTSWYWFNSEYMLLVSSSVFKMIAKNYLRVFNLAPCCDLEQNIHSPQSNQFLIDKFKFNPCFFILFSLFLNILFHLEICCKYSGLRTGSYIAL